MRFSVAAVLLSSCLGSLHESLAPPWRRSARTAPRPPAAPVRRCARWQRTGLCMGHQPKCPLTSSAVLLAAGLLSLLRGARQVDRRPRSMETAPSSPTSSVCASMRAPTSSAVLLADLLRCAALHGGGGGGRRGGGGGGGGLCMGPPPPPLFLEGLFGTLHNLLPPLALCGPVCGPVCI
jgi:hypothetical protein